MTQILILNMVLQLHLLLNYLDISVDRPLRLLCLSSIQHHWFQYHPCQWYQWREQLTAFYHVIVHRLPRSLFLGYYSCRKSRVSMTTVDGRSDQCLCVLEQSCRIYRLRLLVLQPILQDTAAGTIGGTAAHSSLNNCSSASVYLVL